MCFFSFSLFLILIYDDIRTALSGGSMSVGVIPPGGSNKMESAFRDLGAKEVLMEINDLKAWF